MTYDSAERRCSHPRAVATCRHRIARAQRHDAAGVRLVAERTSDQLATFLALAWPGDRPEVAFDNAWRGEDQWLAAYDVLRTWLATEVDARNDDRAAAASDLLDGLSMLADLWELQVDAWFASRAS